MFVHEPMRVAYVVKRYPRYSETFIVREILAHEEAGLEIEIFALHPPIDTHFQDLIARVRAPVHQLPSVGVRVADFWTAFEQAREVIPDLGTALDAARGEEAGHVYQALLLAHAVTVRRMHHLHAPFAHEPTSVARLASRFTGVPYSFTARARDIFHKDVRRDDLERKLREAAGVVTITDFNLAFLRETYGAAAAHVEQIYNGLDLTEFTYEAPTDRRPVIVAVGRLVEKKGFTYLVEACAILRESGCDFTCQIIGAGGLEADLRRQIEARGLHGRVELMGPRPQNEVIRQMRSAAVFTLPCIVADDGDRDGLPNVLFESMALGTPCVSTDVTGIPEILHDGETGLMVPQRDPVALAAALERLLTDPALRLSLSAGARRLIEAEFDVRRNAAKRRALFRRVSFGDDRKPGEWATERVGDGATGRRGDGATRWDPEGPAVSPRLPLAHSPCLPLAERSEEVH
jgi:colanic acid/amylovoran biosynthesis glycosyltransferase